MKYLIGTIENNKFYCFTFFIRDGKKRFSYGTLTKNHLEDLYKESIPYSGTLEEMQLLLKQFNRYKKRGKPGLFRTFEIYKASRVIKMLEGYKQKEIRIKF